MKKVLSLIVGIVFVVAAVVIGPVTMTNAQSDGELEELLRTLQEADEAIDPSEGVDPEEGIPVDPEEPEQPEEPAPEPEPENSGEEEHNAAEDLLDSMNEEFSFAGPEFIEVKEIGEDFVLLSVTQVLFKNTPVDAYKIYYSDTTLSNFENFDRIQDQEVEVEAVDGNMVHVRLEWLESNNTYYVVVAPVHPEDPTSEPLTMISDEVTFNTKEVSLSPSTKVFEDVSYTYEGNTATVTWTPSSVVQFAEIHVRHQTEGSYTKVWTPNMTEGAYTFTITKPGNYFLKMIGTDGNGNQMGLEHIQTVKIEDVEVSEEEPVVQAAPQVGPTTDLLIGLIVLSVIFYLWFRFRRIEH